MTCQLTQHKETLLIEILRAGLDLREKAEAAEAPMLVYLADLLARRARAELETIDDPAVTEPHGS